MKVKLSEGGCTDGFASVLIRWQKQHGRHDLPWLGTQDPYRVWLSEIMLQQTQVATVRSYYQQFLARFPDVLNLASAPLDDVLSLWSGLGYYSRARNLHRCAQQMQSQYGGHFPATAALLQTLPGIGPSTAAAIASICFGERVAILDGNVKRVLARYLGFDADLALAKNERALWQHATDLLPRTDVQRSMPHYTQAVMDLGATVCTPKLPRCADCPLRPHCQAALLQYPEKFPVKTRKLKRSAQTLWLLVAHTAQGAVWLSRQPAPGVWGGLYCVPLFDSRQSLLAALPVGAKECTDDVPPFKHVLTHKDLYLHPVRLMLPADGAPDAAGAWVQPSRWPALGLPAAVRKLLNDQVASISR
ncbi:MAG: A/G-specific adenine glycosylase [Comamonadaceae bacterium CG1_02_60_18]|nr:MAG: A/G-specific adenine glycosylase [Comamonadaceae bacterium CG1_02_60_18]PIQ53707.1 MAG: A/G-specific adenine glycosylase [Comamonadaceae bacterium CG12_big_fil_rev_8_21_14_0_65_59_15]